MKGKPKFKYEDEVQFSLGGEMLHGKIYIIDAYGTWEDPSDVSYDIMVSNYNEHGDCLFKHIKESLVSSYGTITE